MVSMDTRQDVELIELIPDEPFDKRGVKPCVSRDILISCRITAERGAVSSGNSCLLACGKRSRCSQRRYESGSIVHAARLSRPRVLRGNAE